MAVTTQWLQNVTYAARIDRTLIDNLWTEGILGAGSFLVSERGAGTNMTVDITAGVAVVTGDDQAFQGKYLCREQAATTGLVITTAPGSGTRHDLVVLQIQDPNAGGAAGDNAVLKVIAGATGNSTDPAVPDSALVLARVRVATGTAAITNAMIDDLRVESRLSHEVVNTDALVDLNVTTAKIAASAVTTAKIADGSVTASKFPGGAIDTAAIANSAVTSAKIATNAVTSSEIASNTVTAANINSAVPLGLRQVLVYTSNATWSKPSWLRAARIRVQGGGGGGAAGGTTAGNAGAGGGGGGGGYSESFLAESSIGASVTVTVNQGGNGGDPSLLGTGGGAGGNGGASSFGSLVVAQGGQGGDPGFNETSGNTILTSGGPGATTAGAVGQVQVRGGDGTAGIAGLSGSLNMGGNGGSSPLGGGGRSSSNSTGGAGIGGNVAGGGGGGGHSRASGSHGGGSGARGLVIVEMYE